MLGRAWSVMRGRAWSCVVVRGRAWSCVVVRGRLCVVVRGRACVVGHSWSCVVVRGRSCVVVPFCPLRGQHCRDTNERRNEGTTSNNPLNPPGVGWVNFFYPIKVRVSMGTCVPNFGAIRRPVRKFCLSNLVRYNNVNVISTVMFYCAFIHLTHVGPMPSSNQLGDQPGNYNYADLYYTLHYTL